jgi:hypothetical protein
MVAKASALCAEPGDFFSSPQSYGAHFQEPLAKWCLTPDPLVGGRAELEGSDVVSAGDRLWNYVAELQGLAFLWLQLHSQYLA